MPSDAAETTLAVRAMQDYEGPAFLCLWRNSVPSVSNSPHPFEIGRGYELRPGNDLAIIATGVMVPRAQEAADTRARRGVEARVVAMPSLKPIDRGLAEKVAREAGAVVTAEERNIHGGLGSAVAERTVLGPRQVIRA